MDPLLVIGVFALGAAAGSILTHMRHHGIINQYREIHRSGLPHTPARLDTPEMFRFELLRWPVRRGSHAGPGFVGSGSTPAEDTLLGTKSGLWPQRANGPSSELHQREAAR